MDSLFRFVERMVFGAVTFWLVIRLRDARAWVRLTCGTAADIGGIKGDEKAKGGEETVWLLQGPGEAQRFSMMMPLPALRLRDFASCFGASWWSVSID